MPKYLQYRPDKDERRATNSRVMLGFRIRKSRTIKEYNAEEVDWMLCVVREYEQSKRTRELKRELEKYGVGERAVRLEVLVGKDFGRKELSKWKTPSIDSSFLTDGVFLEAV